MLGTGCPGFINLVLGVRSWGWGVSATDKKVLAINMADCPLTTPMCQSLRGSVGLSIDGAEDAQKKRI